MQEEENQINNACLLIALGSVEFTMRLHIEYQSTH